MRLDDIDRDALKALCGILIFGFGMIGIILCAAWGLAAIEAAYPGCP